MTSGCSIQLKIESAGNQKIYFWRTKYEIVSITRVFLDTKYWIVKPNNTLKFSALFGSACKTAVIPSVRSRKQLLIVLTVYIYITVCAINRSRLSPCWHSFKIYSYFWVSSVLLFVLVVSIFYVIQDRPRVCFTLVELIQASYVRRDGRCDYYWFHNSITPDNSL